MKAVLIVDIPDGINAEDIDVLYRLDTMSKFRELFYPEEERWNIGTLKPMPQKKNTEMSLNAMNDWLEHSERLGFNACIDEILGE